MQDRLSVVLGALFAALLLLLAGAPAARAVPALQLYVEGASYDPAHESWVFESSGAPIRLWVIGNVDGPGGAGPIYDVRLSVVYPDPVPGNGGPDVSITLTPSTTSGLGGFLDPSTPGAPVWLQVNDDGALPLLGDGSALAAHGTYGPGFEWQEFALGDFTASDSPVADFIDVFPSAPAVTGGQINVYEVGFIGDVTDLHFDVYDHVVAGNHARYRFAPFSHDAGTGTNSPVPAPEPGTVVLAGLGMLLLGGGLRARKVR